MTFNILHDQRLVTDEDAFNAFDLSLPELSDVKAALEAGDGFQSRAEIYQAYMRT